LSSSISSFKVRDYFFWYCFKYRKKYQIIVLLIFKCKTREKLVIFINFLRLRLICSIILFLLIFISFMDFTSIVIHIYIFICKIFLTNRTVKFFGLIFFIFLFPTSYRFFFPFKFKIFFKLHVNYWIID